MNRQIGPIKFWSSDAASRSSAGGFSAQSGPQDGARGGSVPDHILEQLGPYPAASLRAMVDYGLNDDEIGRYYAITSKTIKRLRSSFGITNAN